VRHGMANLRSRVPGWGKTIKVGARDIYHVRPLSF
jgi:hypothetical protein